MNTLVIGGARSGKSSRALELAKSTGKNRIFIATSESLDTEMAGRIKKHQEERGGGWITREVPLDLIDGIDRFSVEGDVCLVDCLTVWLGNLMHYERNISQEIECLCDSVGKTRTPIIFVSNEVGMGLVPETKMGRDFRDYQGRLNQRLAVICDVVEFVAAGLPLRLKG